MTTLLSDWAKGLVVEGPMPPRRATAYRLLLSLVILASTAMAMVGTLPDPWGRAAPLAGLAEDLAVVVLAFDYVLRLLLAAENSDGPLAGLRRYALSPYGIFDFLAVGPFLLGEAVGLPRDSETIFGILRILKLARYSPALETLGVVVMAEFRPLMSALFIMTLLAVMAATALYFVERNVNPGFVSIPHAMWWSVVTLATLGYGDVVPMTAVGKLIGGGVAILGLCMFALPASILASGFSEEMRRQSFVNNWHLVAKVPFFHQLQASQIAEIAGLLKVYRAIRGEVIVREGDIGDSMYFIVQGQAEVRTKGMTFILKPGDFFGEIALIDQVPRTATVKAVTRCQLLILEAREFAKFMSVYPNLLEAIIATARERQHPAISHAQDPV